MRLKLVLIVSLLATLIGAGGSIGIIRALFGSLAVLLHPSLKVAATFLLPIATTAWAGIFIYRHTARRRRLQVTLATILTLFLTVAAFTFAVLIASRQARMSAPIERPRALG
jgi:hypothetical protein